MARTSLSTKEQLNKVSSQTLSVANISVPYTTIVNRAQIKDLANDLSVRFGVERVSVQQIVQLNSEFGASGEPVFRAVNDTYDQIRFVGAWSVINGATGVYVNPSLTTDYVEITFYGTGLNLLGGNTGASYDFRATVDGGTESANLYSATVSTVLAGRNYTENRIVPISSGLSLGLHTIKIRNASSNSLLVEGFEILNENSTLNIRPGALLNNGSKNYLSSALSSSYNSGFESGTLGTRGGHVLVYLKQDGTVGKAITPTNTSAAYLTSADHTNEEIVRVINWREFGAGRSDDFSTIGTTSPGSNRAFTLDDGTTTLVANTAYSSSAGLTVDNNAGLISLTFVGTGLDLELVLPPGSTPTTDTPVIVDNTSVGNITIAQYYKTQNFVKVVSGLPYGTHTVKVTRPASTGIISIKSFIIYQPKKPTLPTGAVELSEYNIMADFVANAVASIDTSSIGILRKSCQREFSYVGTGWSLPFSSVVDRITGWTAGDGGISGSYFEYTFFGTGVELRTSVSTNRSSNITISLNGVTATTTNFPTMSSSAYGNASFTASTGIASLNGTTTIGAGIRISGLPLAKYTVRFTNNQSTNVLVVDCIDIITPVHFPKIKGPFVSQNTLPIGSCSVGDLREKQLVDSNAGKNIAQAFGSTSDPTTSSTVPIPCPDMSVTHINTTGKIKITYRIVDATSVQANSFAQIYVNGVAVGLLNRTAHSSGFIVSKSDSFSLNVAPGVNKIDLYWYMDGAGTLTATGVQRNLLVEEL